MLPDPLIWGLGAILFQIMIPTICSRQDTHPYHISIIFMHFDGVLETIGHSYTLHYNERSWNRTMAILPYSIRESEPITEASSEQKPKKLAGLYTTLLDMEKFIKVNGLENSECTNPVFIGPGSTFTPDGVLSNEIFGTSSMDRRNRFGWIDLKTHYMNPLAAVKLSAYDRTMADCLYSRGRYSVSKEGKLIDDPDGEAGPEFLYKNWSKLKPITKTTETTKEVAKFFSKPKDELFMTKWPVIPAFYRDINLSESTGSKSSNILNSKYSSLISYTQSLALYADGFGTMTYLTQARVQTIMVEIYQELMIHNVKGSPSKFGMLRRALAGKNLPYTVRLVITAPNLNQESLDRVQVRFGHATIPLHYICALFMPFMVHELKAFFDAELIQRGVVEVVGSDGKITRTSFNESYDENDITGMINKYVNSPSTRFDPVWTPPDLEGKRHKMIVVGRFNKDNTTFQRPATYTDILYIIAERVCQDKHVWLTRYPLDNPHGQWCGRIIVSSTIKTTPCTIGNKVYEFYPVVDDTDPLNAFMTTAQMPNTMIGPIDAVCHKQHARKIYVVNFAPVAASRNRG